MCQLGFHIIDAIQFRLKFVDGLTGFLFFNLQVNFMSGLMTDIHTFFDDIHISETSAPTSLMEPYLLVDFLIILQLCKTLYLPYFFGVLS